MHLQTSAARLVASSVGLLILAGAILLWSPMAAAPGRAVSFSDALFTSTSAVCVTGLVVVDTGRDFSGFGQAVILLLIQLGGLGYMTISSVVAVALGRRMSLRERLALQETLRSQNLEGLATFARSVLVVTVVVEAMGTLVLWLRWVGELGPWRAAWVSLFHAVSAFNNAGFSTFSSSLTSYGTDPTIMLTVSALIMAGGLGFLVLQDLRRWRRQRLSLHSRLVLALTAVLIVGGTVAVLLLEWSNPRTLGPLTVAERAQAAFFHAVSARTAGFNTIDLSALAPSTLYVLMGLMFVGAGPGGTAGGIKVTTVALVALALWAIVRGREEPVVMRRRLAWADVTRAFAVTVIAVLAVNAVAVALLMLEHVEPLSVLFETVSAFGTVGLSTGVAGTGTSLVAAFSPLGKLLMGIMILIGRIGPLTLALALAGRARAPRVRYPEGSVLIG